MLFDFFVFLAFYANSVYFKHCIFSIYFTLELRAVTTDKYTTILIMGAPGSGKGTQSRVLGRLPGYFHVSMGDLLRELDNESEYGIRVQQQIRQGELVSPELAIAIWQEHMHALPDSIFSPQRDQLVLDGLPRNIQQAKLLQPHIDIQQIIHLDCEDQRTLFERIRQRGEGRSDDTEIEVIRHRFNIYREQSLPLLDWYSSEKIAKIDACQPVLEVLRQITTALIKS